MIVKPTWRRTNKGDEMTKEDLKTGMLLLMQDDTLRVIIGNMAISYNNGGLELKDLKFKDNNNCNNWTIKKIYAEPKRENVGGFGAGFDFWLKDKKFIDEKYNPKLLWEYKKFKYPMWFKSKVNKYVVKFTRLDSGTVIVKGTGCFKIGYTCSDWCPHTNTNMWGQVEDPYKLPTKKLKPLNQEDFKMEIIQDLGLQYITETSKVKKRLALFKCSSCGEELKANVSKVKARGQSTCNSCSHKTHGLSKTRLYKIWSAMVYRAGREKGYEHVLVCDGWKSFTEFSKWATKHGYTDSLTIDRINNSGNYEPSNCRWATDKEQSQNRGTNIGLSSDEWSEALELYHSSNLTQEDIAKLIGVSKTSFNSVCAGRFYIVDNIVYVIQDDKLADKDATWCWNNNETLRHLCFWDAKYNSIFRANGNRNGPRYDNFEKILREDEPDWCKEARKHLED